MSYVFDVSSKDNDLGEVDAFVRYESYGDYLGCNKWDGLHTTYNVEFTDKRYALQFKLKFNVVVVKWDESDDMEIVTEQDLRDRGYKVMEISIPQEKSQEFRMWCEVRDFPIVDEIKFIGVNEKFRVYVPENQMVLTKLTWSGM